jgi:quercetin dioxygenase-like cupin family protein
MNIKDEIEFREGGIYSKVLAHSKHFSATLMCMGSGTTMDEHSTPRAGVVHILQGQGEFVLEGEKIAMEEGVVIKMEASAKHSLSAKEDVAFLLYLYE